MRAQVNTSQSSAYGRAAGTITPLLYVAAGVAAAALIVAAALPTACAEHGPALTWHTQPAPAPYLWGSSYIGNIYLFNTYPAPGTGDAVEPVYGTLHLSSVNRYWQHAAESAAWYRVLTSERAATAAVPVHTDLISLVNTSDAWAMRPVNSTVLNVTAHPDNAITSSRQIHFVDESNVQHVIIGGLESDSPVINNRTGLPPVSWTVEVPPGGIGTAHIHSNGNGTYWYECLTHGEHGTIEVR